MELRAILNFGLILLYVLIFSFSIFRRKQLGSHIGLFSAAIFLTFLTEISSYFFGMEVTTILQNILLAIGTLSLYIYYLYKLSPDCRKRWLFLVLIGLNFLNLLVSFFTVPDFPKKFGTSTVVVSVVLMLISCGIFLNHTFNSDRVLKLRHYFPFWFCVCIALIYAALLPLIAAGDTLRALMDYKVFLLILFSVNIVGYSMMFLAVFFSKDIEKD